MSSEFHITQNKTSNTFFPQICNIIIVVYSQIISLFTPSVIQYYDNYQVKKKRENIAIQLLNEQNN